MSFKIMDYYNMKYVKLFEEFVNETTSGELIKPKRGKITKFNHKKYPELAGEFFDLIAIAYAAIGGHAKIKSPEDVFADPDWNYWEGLDIHGDDDFDMIMFGKKTRFGVKYSGVGHDGSSKAKREYISARGRDLNKLGFYIEVSGKLKDILIAKGVPVVTDKETIQKVMKGKNIEMNDDGTYQRYLGGEKHTKTLMGNPL